MDWSAVLIGLFTFAGVVVAGRMQTRVAERQEALQQQLLDEQKQQNSLSRQDIDRDRMRDPQVRRGDLAHELYQFMYQLNDLQNEALDFEVVSAEPPHPGLIEHGNLHISLPDDTMGLAILKDRLQQHANWVEARTNVALMREKVASSWEDHGTAKLALDIGSDFELSTAFRSLRQSRIWLQAALKATNDEERAAAHSNATTGLADAAKALSELSRMPKSKTEAAGSGNPTDSPIIGEV